MRSLILVSLAYFLALIGHNFQHQLQNAYVASGRALDVSLTQNPGHAESLDCSSCRLLNFSAWRLVTARSLWPLPPLEITARPSTLYRPLATVALLSPNNRARAPPSVF